MNNQLITKTEIFIIAVSMVSVWLVGTKSNWTWLFSLAGNLLWLTVGIRRKMLVIIITSVLYLGCTLRGAYLWIVVGV